MDFYFNIKLLTKYVIINKDGDFMKKKEIIKSSKDFTRIIKNRNGAISRAFIINIEKNEEGKTLYGITFVHKIGNAVLRNKLKRRIKMIITNNKKMYQKGLNYIIIIRQEAKLMSYQKLEQDLNKLFIKIKEKSNEEKNI